MSTNDFLKILYLPSGGYNYSPLIRLRRLNIEYTIFQHDVNMVDTLFEFILSTILRYTEKTDNIEEYYLQDFYYIWTQILTLDLMTDKNLKIFGQCVNCQHLNKIEIEFGQLSFTQNSKFTPYINNDRIYKIDEETFISFKHRKVKDNIEYTQLQLNYSEQDAILKNLIYYFLPQINSITYKSSKLKPEEYIEYLTSLTRKEILNIYNFLLEYYEEFGIENKVLYKCMKCEHENETIVYDSLILSEISPRIMDKRALEKIFKNIFELARLPIFSIDDILKMPLFYDNVIMNVINNINFQTGGVII